jgi:Zn-dependent M28 family amino/carboxypeptidase
VVFDPAEAFATVEHLATEIGPREAASTAFDQAVQYVQSRFETLGYRVTEMPVPVPAGDSWGVPVEAGTSENVIADPPGFDPTEPHVVIGAHLDTVAVAPGAEDNGSGVGVVLELARMAAEQPPRVPVRFIAFGAEEPRGRGDDLHHFGSQDYVAALSAAERRAVRAMVSLDRVGVRADAVPVSTGGRGTTTVMDELLAAAGSADVPARRDEQNRASDHWSFEKADIPAARIGSVPYAAYHSADDLPRVVDTRQLDRVGTIVWTWLQTL